LAGLQGNYVADDEPIDEAETELVADEADADLAVGTASDATAQAVESAPEAGFATDSDNVTDTDIAQ
jgi:hypothetical protein